MLKTILNWPKKPDNTLNPWYLILYRGAWLPFIFAGLAITFIAIFLSYGLEYAIDWYKSAT